MFITSQIKNYYNAISKPNYFYKKRISKVWKSFYLFYDYLYQFNYSYNILYTIFGLVKPRLTFYY